MSQLNQQNPKKNLKQKKSSRFETMTVVKKKATNKKDEEKEKEKEELEKEKKNKVTILTFSPEKKNPSPRKIQPENPLFVNNKKVKKPKMSEKIRKNHYPLQRFSSLRLEKNKISNEGVITSPNTSFVLKCVSQALKKLIITEEEEKEYILLSDYEIFDESKFIIKGYFQPLYKIPTEEEIYQLLNNISINADISPEAYIFMLIYIDRMIKKTGKEFDSSLSLTSKTWKRIVFITLLLGFKIWEELAVWNVDFTQVIDNVTVKDLNELESAILNFLHFKVSVNKPTYTKYYLELRNLLSTKDVEFPFRPIDEKMENKLRVSVYNSFS
ncbi:cyclin y isoform a [Anaeramoeba flamelloides]|uniref:Cyclin y isoform a n=1 Tax=Anaeramoeba flamelloides TaxID=1746091 RepID=A0AAV7YMD2_9EUKA|nr:cyclin y isoform a [Anaeramoeba flamelloides]